MKSLKDMYIDAAVLDDQYFDDIEAEYLDYIERVTQEHGKEVPND